MSYPVDEFFADEIAIAATWTPGGGGDASSIMISLERNDQTNDVMGSQFSNISIKAYARTADVSTVVPGTSTLTIGAIVYNIKSTFDDGEGITMLSLSRD